MLVAGGWWPVGNHHQAMEIRTDELLLRANLNQVYHSIGTCMMTAYDFVCSTTTIYVSLTINCKQQDGVIRVAKFVAPS